MYIYIDRPHSLSNTHIPYMCICIHIYICIYVYVHKIHTNIYIYKSMYT